MRETRTVGWIRIDTPLVPHGLKVNRSISSSSHKRRTAQLSALLSDLLPQTEHADQAALLLRPLMKILVPTAPQEPMILAHLVSLARSIILGIDKRVRRR
jgi:hypothetical protein